MPEHQAEGHSDSENLGLDPSPRLTRWEYLLIALLMVAATVLAIPGIGQHLWVDEITTLLRNVRSPAVDIVTQYEAFNNHVLYSLSAHFTTSVFGESAWSLRLPALIFGIFSIPALYYLARQIASWHVAVLVSTFLAFNYFFLWFSLNARGYTGVMLGGLLATILFVRILTEKRASARLLATYAIVVALTAWMQLTGLAVAVAHGLVWLMISAGPALRGNWARPLRQLSALIGAAVLTLLLYFPIIRSIFRAFQAHHAYQGLSNTGLVENVEPAFSLEQKANALSWTLQQFLHQGIGQLVPGGEIAALVLLVVLLAGAIACWRRGGAVFGLLVFPVLVSLSVAVFAVKFFPPRFIFVAFPYLLLLGVMGGYQLASWVLPFLTVRQVLVAGLLVAAIFAVRIPHAWKPKQDFEAATAFINGNRNESVAMVCIGSIRARVIRYYNAKCLYAGNVDELMDIEEQHGEVFVLYTLVTRARDGDILKHLGSSYVLEQVFPGTLSSGDITVMRKRD